MKAPVVLSLLSAMFLATCSGAESNASVELFAPDGQVRSHPLRVFVTCELTENMKPTLVLSASHALLPTRGGQTGRAPTLVARGQKWAEIVDGQPATYTGTLLLFDLSQYPMTWWKPMTRLTPVLCWEEGEGEQRQTRMLVGSREIYLGDLPAAMGWTLLLEALIVLVLSLWARHKTGHARFLVCGPDHYYSLWRVQLVAWTLAVGGTVFCFGMIRMAVPTIPESLVALMGLSLATGTISAAKARSDSARKALLATQKTTTDEPPKTGSAAAGGAPLPETPAEKATPDGMAAASRAGTERKPVPGAGMNPGLPVFADLISDFSEELQQVVLSIPKAQMLFWTVVVLLLFIAKTTLNGQLWEVPWEMVALTGFSQAGYIGEKFTKGGAWNPPRQNGSG